MTASDMAKLRWLGIPPEERSRLTRKGGRARMRGLTKRQRRDLARIAAKARWARKEDESAELPKMFGELPILTL